MPQSSTFTFDPTSPAFTEALEAVRPELERLPSSDLETVQLDVVQAAITALGTVPKLMTLRGDIAARFGESQAAHVDRVETVARALVKAHAEHERTLTGADLEELSRPVVEARRLLLSDAQSLVNRKLLDAAELGKLRGTQGYANQCFDVLQLVGVFRAHWASLEPKTPTKMADLERAEALANRLATTLGVRDQAAAGSSPSGEMRRRAYTLFVRTYEEVRRHVSYLRWREEDADSFAPSLWAGRKRSRGNEADGDVAPSATAPSRSNGAGAPAQGMPGSSPFVSS